MGKAVLPRDETSAEETSSNVAKRDLAGFDRALTYAEAALVKGPKIQLGTGEGGAGVGIIVDNNQQAAARPGTGAAAKRDVGAAAAAAPKVKVTTMYVRSGIPACEYPPFSFSQVSNALRSSGVAGKTRKKKEKKESASRLILGG